MVLWEIIKCRSATVSFQESMCAALACLCERAWARDLFVGGSKESWHTDWFLCAQIWNYLDKSILVHFSWCSVVNQISMRAISSRLSYLYNHQCLSLKSNRAVSLSLKPSRWHRAAPAQSSSCTVWGSALISLDVPWQTSSDCFRFKIVYMFIYEA